MGWCAEGQHRLTGSQLHRMAAAAPWWRFGTATAAHAQATATASTSMHIEHADNDDEAPVASTSAVTLDSDKDDHLRSRSGSTLPVPSTHLHSLTEKKLEMAVLGRAVGLRQLVLLSNAFASKAKSYAAGAYSGDSEESEMDPSIVDLEDEMVRKKREEDWLDSVLDEMLTDEEDSEEPTYDYEPPPIPPFSSASSRQSYIGPYAGSSYGLREPYVHLSIRDRRNAPGPLSLASTSGNSLPIIDPVSVSSQNAQMVAAVRDSGFLEPAQIPLPESRDNSPEGSSASQTSEDDSILSTIREEDEEDDMFDMDGLPPLPDSDDGSEETVPDPYRGEMGLRIPNYRDELVTVSGTPDLAYSSNSLNSFLSNLSSSPSGSFGPTTPTSTPIEYVSAVAGTREAETEASLEQEDTVQILSLTEAEAEEPEKGERAFTAASGLQLVPYTGKKRDAASPQEIAFRDTLSGITSPATRGIFASPAPPLPLQQASQALPKLPSGLLASILGRPASIPVSISASAARRQGQRHGKPPVGVPHPSVHLPIFLPHEVVKALYDSVDFGVPPKSSSPVSTPSVAQATLPAFTLASNGNDDNEESAGVSSDLTIRSAPTSPRGRRRSLSLLDIGGVSHDSTGSLLFSSLGIAPPPQSRTTLASEPSLVDAKLSLGGVTAASFGRGIVADWAFGGDETGSRPDFRMKDSGRADSRSPSRLRHFQALEAVVHNDDFDFGSA